MLSLIIQFRFSYNLTDIKTEILSINIFLRVLMFSNVAIKFVELLVGTFDYFLNIFF